MTLDELVVELGAKIKEGEWTDVFALLDHVKKAFESVFEKIAVASETSLEAVLKTVEKADQLDKLAQSYGIAASEIEALGYAAQQADVPMDNLLVGMRTFARATERAKEGGEGAIKALSGIAGQTTRERLLSAADAFSKMADGQEKTARAQELFGLSGVGLIPFLNKGRAGIEALIAKFETSGVAISKPFMEQAEVLDDLQKDIALYKEALEVRFSSAAIAGVTKAYKALVTLLQSKGVRKAVDMLAKMFNTLGSVIGAVGSWLAKFLEGETASEIALFGLAAAFGTMATAAAAAGAALVALAIKTAGAWVLAAWPLVLLGTMIALVVDELYTFGEGGETVLGDFIYLVKEGQGFVKRLWTDIRDGAKSIWGYITSIADKFIGVKDAIGSLVAWFGTLLQAGLDFGTALGRVLANFLPDFDQVGAALSWLWDKLKQIGAVIAWAFGAQFEAAADTVRKVISIIKGVLRGLAGAVDAQFSAIASYIKRATGWFRGLADAVVWVLEKISAVQKFLGKKFESSVDVATTTAIAPAADALGMFGLPKVQTAPSMSQATASAPGRTSVQVHAPISVTAPAGADPVWLAQTELTLRETVREELSSVMQDTYAAHGGGR